MPTIDDDQWVRDAITRHRTGQAKAVESAAKAIYEGCISANIIQHRREPFVDLPEEVKEQYRRVARWTMEAIRQAAFG